MEEDIERLHQDSAMFGEEPDGRLYISYAGVKFYYGNANELDEYRDLAASSVFQSIVGFGRLLDLVALARDEEEVELDELRQTLADTIIEVARMDVEVRDVE